MQRDIREKRKTGRAKKGNLAKEMGERRGTFKSPREDESTVYSGTPM